MSFDTSSVDHEHFLVAFTFIVQSFKVSILYQLLSMNKLLIFYLQVQLFLHFINMKFKTDQISLAITLQFPSKTVIPM